MRIAEQVTFGGSGLNRAAELRGDADAVARLAAQDTARVLPVWRGKPLLAGGDLRRPGWLPFGHDLLEGREPPVFLGLDEAGPRFACDVSGWEPDQAAGTLDAFYDPSQQHPPGLPGDHAFAELRGSMPLMTPRDAELAAMARAVLGWHQTHGACARCGSRTRMTMAGWQRDCPECGTRHFPRTDPVVIMLITRGNSVLMGRSHHWPEGMQSLLAGFVEPGETVEAAVRREVLEETQIRVGQVDYLASQPWPFPMSLMFGCRGAALTEAITVDPVELESAMWVTREEMMDVFAGNSTQLKPARNGSIAHFLIWNWLADRLD